LHQRHVLFVAMVVVVGDIARGAVAYLARRMCVGVPDGGPLSVLVPRALDLIRRSGDTPIEPIWKTPAGGSRRFGCAGIHLTSSSKLSGYGPGGFASGAHK